MHNIVLIRGGQKKKKRQKKEMGSRSRVEVIWFEDGERKHEPRKVGGL
jgi:hypothetical protein